jgi:hypothetical protein
VGVGLGLRSEVNSLPEAGECHPGEADGPCQKRGRSLWDRLRERKGTHRPGVEVGRGWQTQIELGTSGDIGVGGFHYRVSRRKMAQIGS